MCDYRFSDGHKTAGLLELVVSGWLCCVGGLVGFMVGGWVAVVREAVAGSGGQV